MHAPAPTSKSAPAAAYAEWTIPAAPAGAPAAADQQAADLLSFFSSHRRSTVGEVQPPQVPFGVPPATSISFWATDAYSLDLELSAAEVGEPLGQHMYICWGGGTHAWQAGSQRSATAHGIAQQVALHSMRQSSLCC